jgi:hypothetical protein
MKIYLAVPYTAGLSGDKAKDLKLMQRRFEAAVKKTGQLLKNHIVVCPVVHYHPVAEACDLPRDWEFWKKIDESFVDWCDELWVYMLDGYDKSTGINAEIERARELGKPILYLFSEEI